LYKQVGKLVRTCRNYEAGITPLLVLVAVAVSSILVVGGSFVAGSLRDKGLINFVSPTIKGLLHRQTGFLDANKVNGSIISGSVVGTVMLPDGSFSAYKLVKGSVKDDGNSFEGEAKIQFLSGDNGLGSYEGGVVAPFYLKNGTKTVGVIMDRMLANLKDQSTSYAIKVLQGTVENGKLIGDFVAQTLDTGYIIGGEVDERGNISRSYVTGGAVKVTEAQVSIAVNALSLFKEVSSVFDTHNIKVLAASTAPSSTYHVIGFNKPVFDSTTGTWLFLSPTATTTGVVSTSVTQNIVNYLQNLSQEATTVYQNLPSYLQPSTQVIQGITDIESTNSKLTVSTLDNIATLSLDLTGITAAGVSDGSINEADLVSSNDASNGQCLTYNNSTGGFTWGSCGTSGGSGTITGVTAGDGLTGGGTSGTVTLSILALTGGGLEATPSGISLLTTCGSGQLLKWNGSAWACGNDTGGGGGGVAKVESNNVDAVNTAVSLDFSTDFDVTLDTGEGENEADITIAAGAVSLSDMANLAANSIIGNNTGSAATPIALTASQVKTLLGISTSDITGLGTIATQSASNVFITGGNLSGLYRINGATISGGALSGGTVSGGTLSGTSLSGTGSFTVTGGTGSGETLTLISTTDGTKGDIQFFSSSNKLTSAGALTIAGALSASNFGGSSSGTNTGDQLWGNIPGDLNYQTDLVASFSGKLTKSLTSANIFVGNGSNIATGVAMSGDISIDNTGATTIGAGKVTLANMANLAANSIIGNNTGSPATPLALSTTDVKTLLAIANTDVSGLGTIATQSAGNVFITGGQIIGGTIATGNTITGTTLNGTTGVNTGATAGTQRIDATGNLVNIGDITGTGAVIINTTGNTNGLTLNTGTGSSGNSGAITIQTGGTTTSGTSGNITIDVGVGASANGTIGIGTANSGTITIGRSTQGITLPGFTGNNAVLYGTTSTGILAAATTSSGGLCLVSGAASGYAPTWTTCPGGGGSLDSAYNAGGTITVDAYDVLFNLSDSTNDWKFTIDNATNATIDTGMAITTAGGVSSVITTAIDLTDADIVNAISVGVNVILGTTGDINYTNFDVAGTTGVITILGGQTEDITTQSNNNLTLKPGGTGAMVFNSTNTSASALDLNATGIVPGNAITLDTSDGGIALTAAGASNGDITLAATDDIGINGTAGSVISIGTSNITQTINIGLATNVDVSITDPNWSVLGDGTAAFASVSEGGTGLASKYAPIGADYITVAANGTLTGETAIGSLGTAISTTSTLNVDSTSTLAALTIDANANFLMTAGTGTFTQNYTNTTGTSTTINHTNSASSGTNVSKVLSLAITGTDNAGGTNTITGLDFPAVTAHTNNTYNGITFGTGFNNFLTSGTINITAAGAISGATTLGLSGAITGATATDTINGMVINSSTQTFTANNIADSGALTIKSNTSNALTLDSGTTGAIDIGTGTGGKAISIGTNDTTKDTINIGSIKDDTAIVGDQWSVDNAGAAAFASITQGGTALSSLYAPIGADFITVAANGTLTGETAIGALTAAISTTSTLNVDSTSTLAALTIDANANFLMTAGTGTFTQNYTNTTGTSTAINHTNSGSAGTNASKVLSLAITGTDNAGGSNTITGLDFANVTAHTNNTYNGITFGTGFNNFLTSGTLNITAAGAASGLTSLGLSGAITGATVTNTINNLIINAGAVSGMTTLSSSGDWTWTASTPTITINNTDVLTIGDGTDAITLDTTDANTYFKVGDASNYYTFDFENGPTYTGTARPTKRITLAPEFAGAALIGDGDNNTGTMTSDNASASGSFRNYYKWTTAQASVQDYDIWVRVAVPMDFDTMAATPTLSIDTYSSDTVNGTLTVSVYDTGGTADCSIVPFTPTSATTWQTKTSTTCLDGGTYTPGGVMSIRIHMQSPQTGDVRVGNISFDYLSKF
jgi:hypothetical protein